MILNQTIISTEADGADEWAVPEGDTEAETRSLVVPDSLHGDRLDRALAVLVPEFSRSYLQQRIEAGDVQVEQRELRKPAQKVRVGQRLQVCLRPTEQSQAFVPQDLPIHTVYQDEHLRVVLKPAGCVVHPAPGNWRGTLLNGLLALDPASVHLPRAGSVHRLDKDTSGLMVVARSREAMHALVQAIAARQVQREYLALTAGTWRGEPQRQVDAPIGRDPANRLRMAVVDLARHPGKTASTLFECLASNAHGSLVHARLHTGRTHQIRVHMAHLGLPLVGDTLYGGRREPWMTRQALHAWRLSLQHPIDGRALSWRAPMPEDMRTGVQTWGLGYNGDTD